MEIILIDKIKSYLSTNRSVEVEFAPFHIGLDINLDKDTFVSDFDFYQEHFGDWYYEELTDVNIATHLIIDAFQDKYDTAILISGDSDLVPPIKQVHINFPKKVVSVFFPPSRYNSTVAGAAKGSQLIGRKKLKDNLLPDQVAKKDGFVLTKPKDWE